MQKRVPKLYLARDSIVNVNQCSNISKRPGPGCRPPILRPHNRSHSSSRILLLATARTVPTYRTYIAVVSQYAVLDVGLFALFQAP